ncbi:hypothetical protein ABZT47_40020 [Sphaerisporangium sp. NPDC005289]|uniref:hypothetical protein n=1 Tax=Sphaerisporangium sp. NPDC005289 TaxID=3155247 RepID=UPI0033A3FFF7
MRIDKHGRIAPLMTRAGRELEGESGADRVAAWFAGRWDTAAASTRKGRPPRASNRAFRRSSRRSAPSRASSRSSPNAGLSKSLLQQVIETGPDAGTEPAVDLIEAMPSRPYTTSTVLYALKEGG